MLDKLHSVVSYSAVGVNELTVDIDQGVFGYALIGWQNVGTRDTQDPNPVFSPRLNGSVFDNSVFTMTLLQTITTSKNENQF